MSPGALRGPWRRGLAPGLVALGVGMLWLRFNAPPGRPAAVFAYDLLYYFLPMTELVARRLAAGELPLWNPHSCSGIPLLATLQVGALYPGTWPALGLPAERAIAWRLLVECWLAGALASAWLRSIGNGAFAAGCGGVLFVFACVMGQVFWPASLSALVWLPAQLLCVERLLQRWRWRWWAGLCASVCLQVLAGYPQHLVYSAYLVAPYALVRLAAQPAARVARRAAGLVLAALVGAGLSGVQLLPTLELLDETHRAGSLSSAEVHHGKLSGGVEMADVLKNAVDPRPKLVSAGFGPGAGYLGIPTLVLLPLGLAVAAGQARTWLLLVVGALAFLLSPGYREWTAPLYELYASLPTGGMFRDPQRLRVLTFFCAVALAVPGFDAVARGLADAGRVARRMGVAGSAAAALAIAGLGAEGAAPRALASLALLLCALRFGARRRVRPACAAALLALLLLDLRHATGPGFAPLRDLPTRWAEGLHAAGHVYVDAERFARLREDAGHARLAFPNLTPSFGIGPLAGGYRVSCLEPLVPDAWTQLDFLLGRRRETVQTLSFLPLRATRTLYDVAGVRTLAFARRGAAGAPLERGGERLRSAAGPAPDPAPGTELEVRANADALPRAFVTSSFALRGRRQAWRELARGGLDFRRTVILERHPGFASAPPRFYEPAEIVSYAPERVEVEARAEREALLVLSDTHFPGWTAWVGEREVEILRANGVYRAVRIPAGRHRVVFEYRPASLRRGAALTLASTVLLLALPAAAGWRSRSPGRGGRRR